MTRFICQIVERYGYGNGHMYGITSERVVQDGQVKTVTRSEILVWPDYLIEPDTIIKSTNNLHILVKDILKAYTRENQMIIEFTGEFFDPKKD
jgi:hypothetical protein